MTLNLRHLSRLRRLLKGFTLVEVLIVIAILSVLGVGVVFILNPAEKLKETRDVTRLSDLKTIHNAVSIYATDVASSFGSPQVVYLSLPDSSPTCSSYSLPSLPMGWTYGCAPSSTYRMVNGTGWLPVNFAQISFGSPLTVLPIDPVNSAQGGLYYTYAVGSWELTAKMESAAYSSGGAKDVETADKGDSNQRFEIGSLLTVTPDIGTGALLGDTQAPTTPTGLAVTTSTASTVSLIWNASTDLGGSGLAGYRIFRNSLQVATTTGPTTTYQDSGLTASTTYTYQVGAYDAALPPNLSGLSFSTLGTTQAGAALPSGLIAGYEFEDGGGPTAIDQSGNNLLGTLTPPTIGPSWTAGRYGGGLAFDGSDDYVDSGNSSLFDITSGLTLSTWLNLTDIATTRNAVGKGVWSLRANQGTSGRPRFVVDAGGLVTNLDAVTALAPGNWYHVAGTYDGAQMRLYVNGVLDSSVAKTGLMNTNTSTVRIGSVPAGGILFRGSLDDVRIYNRALSQPEILTDMNTSVAPPFSDIQAPTTPTGLTFTTSTQTTISFFWDASTDNIGIAGYRIFRCQGSACSPTTQVATTTGTGVTYQDLGLTSSTTYNYRVGAYDAALNLSGLSVSLQATTIAGGGGNGSIAGTITNQANGQPVGGGAVELYDSPGTTFLSSTTINTSGQYLFSNITPLDYQLMLHPSSTFSLAASEPNKKSVSVFGGSQTTSNFSVKAALFFDNFQQYTSDVDLRNNGFVVPGVTDQNGGWSDSTKIFLDLAGGPAGGQAMRYDWPARPTGPCPNNDINIQAQMRFNPEKSSNNWYIRFWEKMSSPWENGSQNSCPNNQWEYKWILFNKPSPNNGIVEILMPHGHPLPPNNSLAFNFGIFANGTGAQSSGQQPPYWVSGNQINLGSPSVWPGSWHLWVIEVLGQGTPNTRMNLYRDGVLYGHLEVQNMNWTNNAFGFINLGANLDTGPDNPQSRWFDDVGIYDTRPSLLP